MPATSGIPLEALATRLRQTELFCNADPALVQAMLASMRVKPVRQGDMLLKQGARSDSFLILASGRAQVSRERPGTCGACTLAEITEPAGLGEEALLGAEIRSVSVTMLTDGLVMRIRRSEFAKLVAQQGTEWTDPELTTPLETPTAWLWVGMARTRPRGMAAAHTVELYRFREWMPDLDPGTLYLCCAREDAQSALTAFVLRQRGFRALAVRGGRRAVALATETPAAISPAA